jgi:hypothetical protein
VELDELRTQIREILAAPEFNYEPWWGQEWLEKLSDLLRRILPTGGAMELFGLPIETLLKWIGLLLLPFLPFLLFRLGKNYFIGEPWKREGKKAPQAKETWQGLKRKAEEAAGRGEFLFALRFLYLAALEFFRARHLLTSGKSGTDRVHLKELAFSLGERNRGYLAFQQLVGLFQEKWYGLRECRPGDYRRAEELLAEIGEGNR